MDVIKTKEEYEKALKEMNDAFYGITFLNSQTRRFDDNLNLLRELVNEHFEENIETNFDHYNDEIIELCIDELAISKGKVVECCTIPCSDCEFSKENGECIGISKIRKWFDQPYEKPTYKLTKFEKELLQCYPDTNSFKFFNSLNGMKEKGYFKNVDKNELIKDILENCEVIK